MSKEIAKCKRKTKLKMPPGELQSRDLGCLTSPMAFRPGLDTNYPHYPGHGHPGHPGGDHHQNPGHDHPHDDGDDFPRKISKKIAAHLA